MPLPIAINGVGRVGRALIRALRDREDLELVALNDLAGAAQLAQLLKRDTFHGAYPGEIAAGEGSLEIDGRAVPLTSEPNPADIPWSESGARLVVEATGVFASARRAGSHLRDGVEHVVVSSNMSDADITVCVGVNGRKLKPQEHRIVSAASCTTNCLAVTAAVLDRAFGIRRALANTVHCYNNNQGLVDAVHADPRRARSATVNMIPTTTGASSAIGRILPDLADRMDGFAVRVPAPQVSLIDLVADIGGRATVEAVNDAFREAARGTRAGILTVSEGSRVSTDFIGDSHSAIVDLPLTQTADGRLFRIVAWYDNEAGYAARLADLAALFGQP
jgi:glyceraldehyde 3-phosphate dehydrogenase